MRKVLFVCHGNICRSPMAEGFFQHHALRLGQAAQVDCGSAGVSNQHAGEPPHTLSITVAGGRGINIARQTSRQVKYDDFQDFDLILGMDADNVRQLKIMAPSVKGLPQKAKVDLFMSYAGLGEKDVPDPWGKAERDYETVANMVEAAMPLIISKLASGH